jgi:hypothetical protein
MSPKQRAAALIPIDPSESPTFLLDATVVFQLVFSSQQPFLQNKSSPLILLSAVQMTASACSKLVASTATYPHEVIRSHMHISGIASFSGFVGICNDVSLSLIPKTDI